MVVEMSKTSISFSSLGSCLIHVVVGRVAITLALGLGSVLKNSSTTEELSRRTCWSKRACFSTVSSILEFRPLVAVVVVVAGEEEMARKLVGTAEGRVLFRVGTVTAVCPLRISSTTDALSRRVFPSTVADCSIWSRYLASSVKPCTHTHVGNWRSAGCVRTGRTG